MGERPIRPIAVGTNEAAKMLSISRPTLYQLCNRDDFNASFRVGNRVLFSVQALEKWVEKQTANTIESATDQTRVKQ